MNNVTGPNRHYIPEWLLWKFRQPLLFELDINTGKSKPRNPLRAGSAEGLWPQDIEDSLSDHDNLAAQIYRKKIWNQKHIVLSESERFEFALWLAQFAIRIPNTREDFRQMLNAEKRDLSVTMEVVRESTSQLTKRMRDTNSSLFDQLAEQIGPAAAEEYFLYQLEEFLHSENYRLPSTEQLHQIYMRTNASVQFASIICSFDWRWNRSESPFVIGDNPLVRWDTIRGKWNVGINKPHVEVTMPLGLNLCLVMRKEPRIECDVLVSCDARQTRLYNCRQRLAATMHVYGNSEKVLDFIDDPIIGWSPDSE